MADINDLLYDKLGTLGFVGALPDRAYNHLGSLGYTGAMNDRLSLAGGYRAYVEGLLGAVAAITKNFINLLGDPPQAYYELATPWVATGDFEIEVDFSTTNATTQYLVAYNVASPSSNWIGIHNSNYLVIRVANQDYNILSTPSLQDGKLHHLKVVRIGAELTTTLDGVEIARVSVNTNSAYWAKIGERGTGVDFFKGIISDVKLTDITTPANSLSFGLDELTQDYELPDENVFGSELWDYGVIDVDGTTAQFQTIAGDSLGNYVDGVVYLAQATWQNLTGSIRFNGANFNTTVPNSTGVSGSAEFTFVFAAGEPRRLNVQELSSTGSVADSVTFSVKPVTNVLNYRNIASDVRDTYTLTDGDWVGSEAFTPASTTFIDNGDGTYTQPLDATDAAVFGVSNLSLGAIYIMSARTFNDIPSSGQFRSRIASTIYQLFPANTPAGSASLTSTAITAASCRFFTNGLPLGTELTVGELSMKRLIEVA